MLSLHIITVGRDKETWISDAAAHYKKLLSRHARLEQTFLPEEKYGKTSDIKKALEREAASIKSRLKGGLTIALDITGERPHTRDFASKLIDWQNRGNSLLEFIIGGPYGLDEDFKNKCNYRLSLSPMTMSHQIVRLVLVEQLYRTLNLNAGGNYHK